MWGRGDAGISGMATDSGKGREALAAQLRYEFDKSMSAGPIALIGWLAVISAALIAIAALVLARD